MGAQRPGPQGTSPTVSTGPPKPRSVGSPVATSQGRAAILCAP